MGNAERGMFVLPPLMRMSDRINVEITDTRVVGKDWRVIAMVKHGE
jgi:hypothetical protein